MTATWSRRLAWPAAVVVAYLIPYGLGDYSIHVADIIVIFAIMAIGEGIALGVAGQVNLAQVAFFGLSAYMVAMLTVKAGISFWLAALIAVATSFVAGAVVGIPALRVQSHYLGIVTLGLSVGFTSWVTNASYTGGANGISGVPIPPLFGVDLSDEYYFFYLAVVVGLIAFGAARFLIAGPHGRRLRAMRDDPLATASLGANISVLRMSSFVISSVYAGVAGVLYAGLIRFVSPDSFSMSTMFLLLAMVVIGGRQSVFGCVVGTVGLELVQQALSDQANYAQLGYGIVVVLVVVFAPTGLAGIPRRLAPLLHRLLRRDMREARSMLPFAPSSQPTEQVGASIEIENIAISFRGLKALKDVSLRIPQNQIRGVVGPNGSGKTTLFNILSGLYRPTSGSVSIDGRASVRRKPHDLSRSGMARTFQNLRLFSSMTVRENVLIAADRSATTSIWRVYALPFGQLLRDRKLHRQVDELLTEYGLTEMADAYPSNLPYGIQRRVEICRAMASRPRLLLLDEPAAGLNGEEVKQLETIVRWIRDQGVTVLVVEHNMSLMMSLCDQVTVLSGGAVIADGAPAEVVTVPAVISAYLGGSDLDTAGAVEKVQAVVERQR